MITLNEMDELAYIFDNINHDNSSEKREIKYLIETNDNISFNYFDSISKNTMINACVNRLTEINKEILNYEQNVDNMWNNLIEHMCVNEIFNFRDKFDFFDYMIEKKEYAILIKKRMILNKHLQLIN
jgi:hypothetical protein